MTTLYERNKAPVKTAHLSKLFLRDLPFLSELPNDLSERLFDCQDRPLPEET